ncbi:uncharacterized protein LOC125021504 [Mugil cephalus]|uniref:uncharacterized protein LOC125021504 n=1 Tax=Mugil cephalus TaxID=48193 RepID=UPI001FB6F403|nr:uncharacterized protein LOC125021504 [Mugil cephalus]
MAPLVFASFLSCLILGTMADPMLSSSVHQEMRLVAAHVGDRVTLKCFFKSNVVPYLYWFKQTVGQKPRLISAFYKYKNTTFYDEFKDNTRFSLETGNGKNHLTITDLRISDSAIYYCVYNLHILEFLDGCIVIVEGSGSNIQASVQQSTSVTVQPGDSVTLNCTVHTGTCDEEHSVYWFKNKEESHPGVIYAHGVRNDQCEKKNNTRTNNCVYNLPMKSLNESHAGTYYCAVASCGQILFGNGTTLDFEDPSGFASEANRLVLVYVLSGALTFATMLSVSLAFILYQRNKSTVSQTDSQTRFSPPPTTHAESNQDAESLHYAALNVNLHLTSRRQRNNTNSECVYSSIRA